MGLYIVISTPHCSDKTISLGKTHLQNQCGFFEIYLDLLPFMEVFGLLVYIPISLLPTFRLFAMVVNGNCPNIAVVYLF